MESIKEIAAVFCGVCVLAGGFGLLSGGALEKSAGYILSLIMLVSLVGAVVGAEFDFKIEDYTESAAEIDTELSLSEYQAEYICAKILGEKGISFKKITADATKTEDGGIIINKITIKGADRAEEAIKAVTESGLTDTVKTE